MKYAVEILSLLSILAGASLFSLAGIGALVVVGHVCHGDKPRALRWVKQQVNQYFYGYPVY